MRKTTARRKGRHVMKEFRWLKERFGPAAAKGIRDKKKEMEENKAPTDGTCYWMVHPDVPDKEDCWCF